MRYLFIYLTMFSTILATANPFRIDFSPKEDISNEDYIYIQQQLKNLRKSKFLDQFLVPEDSNFMKHYHFCRCTVGIRQTMIRPEAGLFPFQDLVKIGKGGDHCIVSFASYDRNYDSLIKKIPSALEECGFNGYFWYRIGGFPNPTGKEIQYAGVPYAFKIFMMLEAQKLGFNNVLWIDSSALPLRDPTPLFEHIEKTGALIHGWNINRQGKQEDIFSAARKFLYDATDVDVYFAHYIPTGVFGLDLSTPQAKQLVNKYYELVETGIGFLSEWPETYVLMALFDQAQNKAWKIKCYPDLVTGPENDESETKIQELKRKGIYFYIRKH